MFVWYDVRILTAHGGAVQGPEGADFDLHCRQRPGSFSSRRLLYTAGSFPHLFGAAGASHGSVRTQIGGSYRAEHRESVVRVAPPRERPDGKRRISQEPRTRAAPISGVRGDGKGQIFGENGSVPGACKALPVLSRSALLSTPISDYRTTSLLALQSTYPIHQQFNQQVCASHSAEKNRLRHGLDVEVVSQ